MLSHKLKHSEAYKISCDSAHSEEAFEELIIENGVFCMCVVYNKQFSHRNKLLWPYGKLQRFSIYFICFSKNLLQAASRRCTVQGSVQG